MNWRAATRALNSARANWAGRNSRRRMPSPRTRTSQALARCPRNASGRERRDSACLLQQLLELPVAIHLERDIAAADQLAFDVELRVGRPVRVAFERLAQLRVIEDIDVMKLGAEIAQCGDGLCRKAALRKVGVAFHEQHHRRGSEFLANSIVNFHLTHLS